MNFRFSTKPLLGPLVSVALLLSGCGTLPPPQSIPERLQTQQFARGSAAPNELGLDHIFQPLDTDKRLVYGQNQGGSAALGILIGPLGVMANIKNIERNTQLDLERIKGKVALDPLKAFQNAALASGMALREPAAANDLSLTPWTLVWKSLPDTVDITARVLVAPMPESAKIKQLPIVYQLKNTYTLGEFEKLTPENFVALQAELTAAYAAMLSFVAQDQASRIATEKRIILTESIPSFIVFGEVPSTLIQERDGYVWIRLPWAIVASPADRIKYKTAP